MPESTVSWSCLIEFLLRMLRGVCGCHNQKVQPTSMGEQGECDAKHRHRKFVNEGFDEVG